MSRLATYQRHRFHGIVTISVSYVEPGLVWDIGRLTDHATRGGAAMSSAGLIEIQTVFANLLRAWSVTRLMAIGNGTIPSRPLLTTTITSVSHPHLDALNLIDLAASLGLQLGLSPQPDHVENGFCSDRQGCRIRPGGKNHAAPFMVFPHRLYNS